MAAALANSQKFVPNVQVGGGGAGAGISGLMMAILGQQLTGTPGAAGLPGAAAQPPAAAQPAARR